MTKTLCINTTVVYIISLKYCDIVATQQFLILCFSYYEKLEDSGVQFKLIIDLNRYTKQCCSNDLFSLLRRVRVTSIIPIGLSSASKNKSDATHPSSRL